MDVVDGLTRFIIDFEIISKYCSECTAAKRDLDGTSAEYFIRFEGHKVECVGNYLRSSNAMEMKVAEILYKRFISCGIQYISTLSDGDAKTYPHLLSINILVVK